MNIPDIDLNEFDYDLPEDRIAQYPVGERDMSKLLVFQNGHISDDIFVNVHNYLPKDSLLVFNNTRVIRARLLFRKDTGAAIEILCLEPLNPSEYELSFGSTEPVEWKCIIGNLKKWKKGEIVTSFKFGDQKYNLTAEKLRTEGETSNVCFRWDCPGLSFGEVIEATGHIPLPPYISRDDEAEDVIRYQTVYSRIKGSVAAPTAGLHFTDSVLNKLKKNGNKLIEITLHVGAGTFQPVKTRNISDHEMHCEHFFVTKETIESLLENLGNIVAVGTTSVRTLESLYWLGVELINNSGSSNVKHSLGQWDAFTSESTVSVNKSLEALLNHLKVSNLVHLQASTKIMIIPGYKFRLINGLVTNFHQPHSSLLLLISAWTGEKWKEIYRYAMDNNFRFLSYGDSSLLLS